MNYHCKWPIPFHNDKSGIALFIDSRVIGYNRTSTRFEFKYYERFPSWEGPQLSDHFIIHDKYLDGFAKVWNRTDNYLVTAEDRLYFLYDIALIRLTKPVDVEAEKAKVTSICLPDQRAQPIGINEDVMFGRTNVIRPRLTRPIFDISGINDYHKQEIKDLYDSLLFIDKSVTNLSHDCEVINTFYSEHDQFKWKTRL